MSKLIRVVVGNLESRFPTTTLCIALTFLIFISLQSTYDFLILVPPEYIKVIMLMGW